jgi:transcriptional regulator of arginine metabolism
MAAPGRIHPPPREARRDAIRAILASGDRGRAVTSQDELRRLLRARGFKASQATLSRDMAVIGAQRAAGADGPRYHVDGDGGALPLDPVRRLVDGVDHGDTLVVVRTKASAASTVARALDEARLDDVLGTIAGDDIVFVAPRRSREADRLARRLRALFGLA